MKIRTMTMLAAIATAIAATIGIAATAQAEPPDKACSDLGGTVAPDRNCHVHSETSGYTVDMSYPLDYPDPQALADFMRRDRDEFVNWVDQNGPDGRGRPYEYTVTAKAYRSGRPDTGTLSLVLEIDDDTGLAHQGHPATSFQAFNYDLGERAPITFDTLFKPDAKPVEVLTPMARALYDAPMLRLLPSQCQNFAITDDAVIFFFGEGQLIPADNTGPRHISVPRSELAPLMA